MTGLVNGARIHPTKRLDYLILSELLAFLESHVRQGKSGVGTLRLQPMSGQKICVHGKRIDPDRPEFPHWMYSAK